MIIKLEPQVREANFIQYILEEGKVTATINNITDIFDFTGMPDGELQLYDDESNTLIETTLGEVPILGARKEDGVLSIKILFTIDMYEKDKRLLFPEPMTLDEFNDLMAELVERDKEVELDG